MFLPGGRPVSESKKITPPTLFMASENVPAPVPKKRRRHRAYTFTIFTESESHPRFPGSDYSISGREKCPTTGRQHYQCYAHYPEPTEFSLVKSQHPTAHIEAAKGNAKSNKHYCSKDADFVETGIIPQQGGRSDLMRMCEMLSRGHPDHVIRDAFPSQYLRYSGYIQRYRNARKPPPRQREVQVFVHYGETGTGKTRAVFDATPEDDLYEVPYYDKKVIWFDGYSAQSTILLDDFDGTLDFRTLLKLTDRYSRQWPVKGSFVKGHFKTIYITSDTHPSKWYPNAPDNEYRQLKRRITKITEFKRLE